ncbi:MAG: fatty acid desaturase [Oligoflexia bacterium]|nr:fatty acid desaturase [Oligoflexia bacterium]
MNTAAKMSSEDSAPVDAPRTGAQLVRATRPFVEENRLRTWAELLLALALCAASWTATFTAPWLLARLAAGAVTSLLMVRLFIIYHDAMHGAVFHRSRLGHAFMWGIGLLTLSPPAVWKETHDYHHKNNCKLPGTAIGSYPIVTTRMWRRMTPGQRRAYRIARSPLFIALGYFSIFMAGMCMGSFFRSPRTHWAGPVAILLHVAAFTTVVLTLGWEAALVGILWPMMITFAAGGYLFYAQHNFPGVYIASRQTWSYHDAALRSSSMFEMSPLMHWFTGNIGYHHVHHLNHRIPFYNLPKAMKAIPELQHPGRTSWRPSAIAACFALKLWDPKQQRMVGYSSAKV